MQNFLALLGNLLGSPDIVLLFALAFYVIAIFALIEILKSTADSMTKLLWCVIVWLIPILGLILYYTIGRDQIKTSKL